MEKPFLNGLSLRASLLIFLVLPLTLILFGAGYYSLQRLESEIERRMQEDLELIARAIRGPLEYSLEQNREGSVQQALDSLFRLKRVYGAYVYDSDGRRTASSGAREPAIGSSRLMEMAAEGDHRGEYQQADATRVYSYFVPLTDSAERNIGLLQLTREEGDFTEYIRSIRLDTLIFLVLLSGLLLGVILFGLHRIVGRNLRQLTKSVVRIAGGERHHRTHITGSKEFCQLSAGMNSMLDTLEQSERALEKEIDEQQRLKEELLQSQKMAAIGQLAAGVAHELGTPLSVVSGKAQRLLRREGLPQEVQQELQDMRTAVGRTEEIVRMLLDFGRRNPLRKKTISFDALISSAVDQLKPLVQEKPVQLKLTSHSAPPLMAADRIRIEQALVNLLTNALQAAAENGVVEYGWFQNEQEKGFYVADDGSGIPEPIRDRLFEPFFTTKAVGEGTGLGLAVAQAAIKDHGGAIRIDRSTLGGALFTVTLPNEP
ncbi:MAG: ATP-binding protein [Pelovirga sp.]